MSILFCCCYLFRAVPLERVSLVGNLETKLSNRNLGDKTAKPNFSNDRLFEMIRKLALPTPNIPKKREQKPAEGPRCSLRALLDNSQCPKCSTA